jgi:hypothetical protein
MPERMPGPGTRLFLERAGRIAIALLLGLCAGAAMPQASAPKSACTAPEFHQFDFWIGDWDVADANGKPVGRNRIATVQRGCALTEQWEGKGGVTGTSLNAWDAERRRWRQTWIDSTGSLLLLEGEFVDGRMVLWGSANDASGKPARQRITWQKLADGRVRQTWESSVEGSATWSTVFDGYYSPRGSIFHVPLL